MGLPSSRPSPHSLWLWVPGRPVWHVWQDLNFSCFLRLDSSQWSVCCLYSTWKWDTKLITSASYFAFFCSSGFLCWLSTENHSKQQHQRVYPSLVKHCYQIRSVPGSQSETLFRVGFVHLHLHLQTIIAAAADAVFRPVKVLLRQFLCIRVIYVGMENKEAAHKLKLTTQNTTNRWNAELTI